MSATIKFHEVYRADWSWWEIVDRQGRVVTVDDSEGDPVHTAACVAAGYNPEGNETSVL
jgi:hypothetical protein